MAVKRSGKGTLLGRSLDIIRGVSGRFHKEAERAWRLSGWRVEAATLRRKRMDALQRLGEAVQAKIRTGALPAGDLSRLSERVADLDMKLALIEEQINRAVSVSPRRRTPSADKAPRESRRLELVGAHETSTAEEAGDELEIFAESRPPASRPLPIDPLEDILGAAEDIHLEDLEKVSAGKRKEDEDKEEKKNADLAATGEEKQVGL